MRRVLIAAVCLAGLLMFSFAAVVASRHAACRAQAPTRTRLAPAQP
jgi:hypothetical protein